MRTIKVFVTATLLTLLPGGAYAGDGIYHADDFRPVASLHLRQQDLFDRSDDLRRKGQGRRLQREGPVGDRAPERSRRQCSS